MNENQEMIIKKEKEADSWFTKGFNFTCGAILAFIIWSIVIYLFWFFVFSSMFS